MLWSGIGPPEAGPTSDQVAALQSCGPTDAACALAQVLELLIVALPSIGAAAGARVAPAHDLM